MGDTFALMRTLEGQDVRRAVIVGAGYVGLEMAEALVARGVAVTQVEQLPEVLPTVDPELGALVRAELQSARRRGARCGTRVDAIQQLEPGSTQRLEVSASGPDGDPLRFPADLVLVVGRGTAPTANSPPTPAPSSGPEGRSSSTARCAPTSPTSSPPVTA